VETALERDVWEEETKRDKQDCLSLFNAREAACKTTRSIIHPPRSSSYFFFIRMQREGGWMVTVRTVYACYLLFYIFVNFRPKLCLLLTR